MNAEAVIARFALRPLSVEGGFFHECYRSGLAAVNGRCCGTSIYYLLRRCDRSLWHRVASDEIWYYHAGAPARQLILSETGGLQHVLIGPPEYPEAVLQSVIPAGSWQSAWLEPGIRPECDWGLFGAAVYPGFEYEDFTAASDDEIAAQYPQWRDAIAEELARRPVTGEAVH